MGNIEDLKIILRAEVDKAISDLKRASREGKNAEKDWDGISKAFKKNIEHSLSLKNAFSQLSMQVAGGIAIYQLAGKTIQAIGKFASDSVKETTEAAEGHARLEAQLRATGYAAGFTVDELEGMASELQRVTKIEDDEVRSAQSTLLKFTSITGEEFKKATALSLDYAKATGGSASSAAQTLGQALEDPIAGFGKLRKAGVMLSDEEENLARQFVATGEEAKAKAVLLKALEDRVGGVAKAVGGADPAGMKTLRLAIKDVKEEAGQLIAVKIEPWVTALADEVERLRARLASKNENANAILQPIKFGNLIDTGDISGVREAIKNLSGKVSKEIVQAWIDEARKRNPLATSAQAAAIRAAEQELLNMSPLTVTGGGTSGGANNSDKKAAEHIKAVNDEINKNVLAIKLRASALGKEADTQEILNSYVSGYLKLIGDSNGLITEKNSTALALVGTINELKEAITAQQMLATKTAAWNALAQQSTTILEENRSTVDSLYKSIAQLSGADERKLQRDQALAKGNEALAAGNAELAESFFLIVDALDQLERKTVAQQVLATKTAAWNTLAQQSTTILEENRSTVDSLYKSIDQLSGADERKLQRDQALAKGNEALAAGNAELAESFFLIVDALDQLERKTVAQQILATKTAAWNALAQQSMTILEENRSTVDSLYKSIDQLSGVDERKLQRDQALAKGNEALAAGNAELAESYFLIVDALDQIERKTVAQQVLATKTAAWNALAQQSTAILEENRSTVDSLYKSIDQLSGADERKLQRDQALAKGNEALAAGNAELAESYFLIVDALNVLIKKTNEFDSKKFFEELGDQALASAESVIASGLNDAFSSIGEAMASGESSADAFGAAMKNFFTSVLQQTSMLAINAGLRLLVEGGITMLPAAIGLLALGGVSAIAAGAISASGQVRQVDYDQYIIDPVIEAETDLAKMRINLIEDQLEKERELRDENLKKIEQQFDMEFSVLQDLWERGLISTQEYKNQAATLRSNEAAAREAVEAPVKAKEAMIEQIEDARKQKLSVLSIEGKKLQDELNGMSGWQKFWSGRDEQLKAQLNTIDARIKATNAAQSLPEISAAKYGADFITAGPRLLKVGDNPGGRERVRVEPIGTPNRFGPSQEQIIIQISGPVYGVEDLYLKLEKAGEQLLRGGRIKAGVFG